MQSMLTSYGWRSTPYGPNGNASHIMLVLDEHNACFQIWQRLALRERNPIKRILLEREWRRLQEYEAHACVRFDHLVAVTEQDQTILQGLIQSQKRQIRTARRK